MKSRVSSSWRRTTAFEERGLAQLLVGLVAVAQEGDAVGGGRHALGHHGVAEQGVNEARLAGVELAGHHEQEQLVEVGERVAQGARVAGGNVGAEARERRVELGEQRAQRVEQRLLPLGEHGAAAKQSSHGGSLSQ